jgi:hypothetical protein
MSKRIKIVQDDKNFNRHTEEGMRLLKHSVEEVGVIESITVASDGKIISGNAREETFSEVLGEVEPIVVETDGTQPIVIKRTDIQSGTDKFYKAAILANTTPKENIDFNHAQIRKIAVEEHKIDVEKIGIVFPSQFENSFNNLGQAFDSKVVQFPITIISTQEEFEKWEKIKQGFKTDSDFVAFRKIIEEYEN